jgi:hypothetical protein
MQFYEGPSLVIHRLKRMQYVADIFFVLSGISMVDTVYAFLRRWFENYETYITYFYNKWVVFLLIAALLELYTTHRISHELISFFVFKKIFDCKPLPVRLWHGVF